MRQAASRANLAPGHLRPRQQSVKETQVEIVEDLLQVIEEAARRANAFAPTRSAAPDASLARMSLLARSGESEWRAAGSIGWR